MATAETEDFASVDFNQEWFCFYQSCKDPTEKKQILSKLNQFKLDHCWSAIELPHRFDTNLGEKPDANKPFKWWYCKQFDWISPAEPTAEQRIYIDFELANDYRPSPRLKDVQATIWLNGAEIFRGLLFTRHDSIELSPKHLRRTDSQTDTTVHGNILVICCVNTHLCVDTYLLIHGKVICASGEVKVDERVVPLDKKHDGGFLDYTVNMDDADGRISVNFNPRRKSKSKSTLSPTPSSASRNSSIPSLVVSESELRKSPADHTETDLLIPRLAIVILIVGTRGDVQPFIALGQALRAAGHRVRLATHETFRSFVRGNGLEFYPLAGDPADLMSFMVKNAGIIPSMSSIVEGDIAKKRHALADILASTWQACIQPDDETNLPFVAEAIIANPPSFGHIHCAEKLQIPLHIMFTMPWTPTRAFPHPLANIDSSIGPTDTINFYSYDVIEMLTWTGMRDIINSFRKKTLELSTLHTRQAIHALIDERVPHTYCWSPALVAKPQDWGRHIDISGFFFLNLGTAFTNPPADLLHFLGLNRDKSKDRKSTTDVPPPIYIGFGSITGHDSRRILTVVVNALEMTGYRALLSGLANESDELPSNIFKIGNVPHDWLFQHVSAVCHNGGAGTTAAGLRAGKPTIIVPFFGDQFFWGTVIEKSGAGPTPLPGKSITAERLAEAFRFVHKTSTRVAAERIRDAILKEDGCQAAVHAFHANLPLTRMHSDLEPTFAACFRVEKYNLQLSRPVAQILVLAGVLEENELKPHMTREWQFMYNDRIHLPAQGIIEHSQKAFTCMFTDTAADLKRVANNTDPTARTLEGAGTIAKGFGLGIGHLSIGCLSLYGEMTDTLDYVIQLYDPYSDPKPRTRPRVTDFKSGAKAAGQALWNGWKEGFTGIVTQPRKGYEKHGAWGGAAGTLIATVNMAVKPSVGTMSSITWLGRGAYASVAKAVETYQNEGRRISTNLFDSASPTSNGHDRASDDDSDIPPAIKKAALVSGFHPSVCQHIIGEFEKIKAERTQTSASPSSKKKNIVSEFLSNGKDSLQGLRGHKRTPSS